MLSAKSISNNPTLISSQKISIEYKASTFHTAHLELSLNYYYSHLLANAQKPHAHHTHSHCNLSPSELQKYNL